mmetsp:Transcript_13066/g.26193  ORF Transcript_13066/g.26193 Transcript_13066/m.26193 type:complete len:1074 (+) Transcript_13066:3-3224(+)
MTCPRSAMITADLVAASDAGRAVLSCCKSLDEGIPTDPNFWDVFENTTTCVSKYAQKTAIKKGEQLLINTLRDRTKAEKAFLKANEKANNESKSQNKNSSHDLADFGEISTRAPFLAFLIHQRFSSRESPPVTTEANADFERVLAEDKDRNALYHVQNSQPPLLADTPSSFGSYARTLPSAVLLPICWERNELSLLSSCMPGVAPLQEIANTTMQLVAEFIAVINAGILTRFPSIFSPGMITWERWVWAYSVFASRTLPASMYMNEGEGSAELHVPLKKDKPLYSPAHIWDELGVLVPFLDMINHEAEAHSVLWQQNRPSADETTTEAESSAEDASCAHLPRALITKRVKKQQQVYFCYGGDNLPNKHMMLDYGFAQMLNPADTAGFGWGLMDAIGNVQPPAEFNCDHLLLENSEKDLRYLVYESNDPKAINDWWSDERLTLLEKEAFPSVENSFMSSLKMGNKMVTNARLDGVYDPILLAASLVSTMPNPELQDLVSKMKSNSSSEDGNSSHVLVSKRHQRVLRSYLIFILSRKLEKLLENLSKGLKNHYRSLNLWTKASDGGIRYVAKEKENQTEEDLHTGWQTFFDHNAYAATMEVEKHYYTLAPGSCVLALIDGQLQSLQHSIDNLSTWEKFEAGVLKQLGDLGFNIMTDEEDSSPKKAANGKGGKENENDSSKSSDVGKKEEGKSSPKKKSRNRKRNNSNNNNASTTNRPAAIKLHIGNLSYQTTPSDLFDFFSRDYGRDNVLECHIPAERATGKSRGFGFVTLPENIAREILDSGRKCDINGRILKVAESNSAGTNKPNRHPEAPPPVSNDRCGACGYRPKYCVCQSGPNLPDVRTSSGYSYGPGPLDRDHEHYGRDRYYRDRNSRSPSPYYRRRSERDEYSRERDRRYYDYDVDRSRSRSHSRDRGRDRRRDSRRDRKERSSRDSRSGERYEKSRDRSRERFRDRSRSRSRERSRERLGDRDRGRSGDRTRDRDRSRDRRDRHSKDHRSRGRRSQSPNNGGNDNGKEGSLSPEISKSNNGSDERAQDSRKRRSRSRSRERSRKSRRKKRRARSRSRSPSEGTASSM